MGILRQRPTGLALFWLLLIFVGNEITIFAQAHAFFRKLPRQFEWGWGSTFESVTQWHGPFDDSAAIFDVQVRNAFHENRSTGVWLHLGPGTWKTRGLNSRASLGLFQNGDLFFGLMGAGMEETTLLLDEDAPYDPCQGYLNVIANDGAGYTYGVQIKDLTIDCNWAGQNRVLSTVCTAASNSCRDVIHPKGDVSYKCGFKLGGISLSALFAVIERVQVVNWGANGMRPITGAGVEAFGISLTTSDFAQVGVPLVVRNCRVGKFTSINGGYCTGIVVCTHDPGPWTKPNPFGPRKTLLARIESNEVIDLTEGIAYGCAFSEQVLFLNNTANNCKIGFNCDSVTETNNVTAITIESNTFSNVFSGINLGAPGYGDPATVKFSDIRILNNSIHLKGDIHAQCWSMAILRPPFCGWVESYGIRLHGATGNVHIAGNRFSAVPKSAWQDSLGPRSGNFFPIQVIYNPDYPLVPGCDCAGSRPVYNLPPIIDTPNFASQLAGTFGEPVIVRVNSPQLVP